MGHRAMMGAVLALTLAACTYDFEAASKRYAADPSTGGAPGATSSSSSSAGGAGAAAGTGGSAPSCYPLGDPGPFNLEGELGATPPYTYWYWPQDTGPLTSLEWALSVDFEPPNDGYFWAHQFGFAAPSASPGFVGIQQKGTFILEEGGPVEITKMALFSVAGALDAEAGLPSPNGTVHDSFDGEPGFSVHIRYSWQPCNTYGFRLAHTDDDPEDNPWYGAWVRDETTGTETMIGRILVPAAWGPLDYWSVYFSERFGFNQIVACEVQEHASAVFEFPTGNAGTVAPTTKANKFQDPPHCPSSRFTDLDGAVRQEMGVPVGR